MKKKTYLVILALCAAMAMTACGTSAGQKEETKSTAESQDTADEKDSKAADSAESDSDKESTGTVSGDTRLVSVDDVSKYVTIGQYKGLSLDKTVEAVTDDMVDGRIKEELQNKAEEVTEGSVQNGDVVTINYVGTKDGVAFDGGTANNYELTIGSNLHQNNTLKITSFLHFNPHHSIPHKPHKPTFLYNHILYSFHS